MIISCKNLFFFKIILIYKQCGRYITSTRLFSFIYKKKKKQNRIKFVPLLTATLFLCSERHF